jgi:DNA repair protein RecO (recombination protein O)
MATYKTKGIVVGRHNLGEADRIMVILTPEHGVVRAVARGVRRIKSRMAGHLELFCESELMLAEGRNLDVVTSARLLWHGDLTADYSRLQTAYLVAEMISRLSGEEQAHPGMYELVQATLQRLADGADAGPALELWFKLRLLDVLGHRPDLAGCMICGSDDAADRYYFNNELGGLVDSAHKTAANLELSQQQIKLWRLMFGHDFDTIRRVPEAGELAAGSLGVINGFYHYTFGRTFHSSASLG